MPSGCTFPFVIALDDTFRLAEVGVTIVTRVERIKKKFNYDCLSELVETNE